MSGTKEIRCPIQQFWKDIKTRKVKIKWKYSRVTSYCYPKIVDYYICPKGCGRVDYGNMRLNSFRIIIILKDIEGEICKIDKEDLDIQEWKAITGLPLQLLQA